MNTDGLRAKHTFLETLHVLNALPLTFLTAITGIVFLALLYRFLFAGSEPGALLRAPWLNSLSKGSYRKITLDTS